jgi:hypothetical protein
MTVTTALLAELRLLRAMGEDGRAAAVRALRSARLGRRPENPDLHPSPHGAAASTASTEDDPMKLLAHDFDAAIVQRGGRSIFDAKACGELSAEAEERLAAWAEETPRRHPRATGRKPLHDEPEGFAGPRRKPGRIVGGLTGKLGGYASDRDEGER